jgi:hypothetical protein
MNVKGMIEFLDKSKYVKKRNLETKFEIYGRR